MPCSQLRAIIGSEREREAQLTGLERQDGQADGTEKRPRGRNSRIVIMWRRERDEKYYVVVRRRRME